MTNTHEVAQALEMLVAKLREHPATPCEGPAYFYLRADKKEDFVELVKAMPRPLTKKADTYDFDVRHRSEVLNVTASIRRESVCRLVRPAQEAVYDCEPLLSEGEMDEIA